MARRVLIQLVGSTTKVSVWETQKPLKINDYFYNKGANYFEETTGVCYVDDSESIHPRLTFVFDELEDNLGAADIKEYLDLMATNLFFLVASSGGSVSPSGTIVQATRVEIQALVLGETLVPGTIYNITDADVSLYGGTSIFLQALSETKLSLEGTGLFYTPKYDNTTQGTGYGIWNINMEIPFDTIVGDFQVYESVTADNGATGLYKVNGIIYYTSGDWDTAVSITGDASLATANITPSIGTTPNFAVNNRVHYGAYTWINLNGEVGTPLGKHELDSEWEVIPFNITDYNVYSDTIQYDFENDKIIGREDKYGNTVKGDYQWFIESESSAGFDYGNPIKDFQWGNAWEVFNTDDYFYIGVRGNQVINSYFDCINSVTTYIFDNILTQNSAILRNEFSVQGTILKNVLEQEGVIADNLFFGSASIYRNLLTSYSTIREINANQCSIGDNCLSDQSRIAELFIYSGAVSSNTLIESRLGVGNLDNSSIVRNSINQSRIESNILNNSTIEDNNLTSESNLSNNTLLASSSINHNIIQNGYITNNEIDSAGAIISNVIGFGQIDANIIVGGQIRYNEVGTDSYIASNSVSSISGTIEKNSVKSGSYISENAISPNCSIRNNQVSNTSNITDNSMSTNSFIEDNLVLNGSVINSNTFVTTSRVANNVLSQSFILSNNLSTSNIISNQANVSFLDFSGAPLVGKTIKKLIANGVSSATGADISAATIIFGDYAKNMFTRLDGTVRLSYFNNLDLLTVVALTT